MAPIVIPRTASMMARHNRNARLNSPYGAGARALPSALQPSARAAGFPGAPSPRGIPGTQFSTDPNSIVTVQVATIQAPTPNTFQQCGCFVSFGSTNIAIDDAAQLTQLSDLDALLVATQTIATATWSTGLVTITSSAPIIPAFITGSTPQMSVTGMTPAAYNYTGTVTIVDSSTFTYSLVTDPGAIVTSGSFQPQAAIEISQAVSTFFAQGNAVSVWVLELGLASDVTTQAGLLDAWITSNPSTFYGFVLPRLWGSTTANVTSAEVILKKYQSPESKTYFWLTVTPSTLSILGSTYKDVIQFVEAPSVGVAPNISDLDGEMTIAAMFYNAMAFRPSNINRVAPMAFKYLYGVTAYPTKNMGPTLKNFKTYCTNYVSTGAEGGISYYDVYEGVTLDGYDYFNWWWTIDWVAINTDLNLSNAIINGSNNPAAPLYYDQNGINFLASVLYSTMATAQTYGMVVGALTLTSYSQPGLTNAILGGKFDNTCDVNAVSFTDYTLANPGDFKIGEYDGLSVLFIPARGFIHILVQITASSLVGI